MNDTQKLALVGILTVLAVGMGIYFLKLGQQESMLNTGQTIDETSFKTILTNAENVAIITDVRGIADDNIKQKIYQCGIDFAGSPYLGSKNMTYFSIDEKECITPEGSRSKDSCINNAKNLIVIYINSGNGTKYYSNAMFVGIDDSYRLGVCGIKAAIRTS